MLRVGEQIADALDRAHRAGVIHRDLKPGNVMLTKSGAKLKEAQSRLDWPALSRDLQQVALVRGESSGQTADIWLLDIATKQMRRATFTNTTSEMSCALSPDGQRLAVASTQVDAAATQASGSAKALWIQPVSGARTREILLEKTDFLVTDWSPDGKVLLSGSRRSATSFDITYVRLDDEDHRVHDLLNTRFNEFMARFSPDGAWVTDQSNESGQMEVSVADFPDATCKWQVSRDGGYSPAWRFDGREIYFQKSDRLMPAPVTHRGDGIDIGPLVELGRSEVPIGGPYGSNGKRFLVVQFDSAGGSIEPIQIIRN